MQRYKLGFGVVMLLLATVFVVSEVNPAFAVTSRSSNFEASEAEFGAGSALETCSGLYCARASIGNLSPGGAVESESTAAFSPIEAGSDEPLLEVIIDPGDSNLGVLDIDKTASKSSIVRIRNYLSQGYTVQLIGKPPVYDGHTLNTPSVPTESAAGTEQFGVNVVKNTTPEIGANPVFVPNSETSFGEAAPGYNQPDLFKYSDGDVIAFSEKESGRTDFTVSMIINVSGSTPAGHYATDFSVLVVPVY